MGIKFTKMHGLGNDYIYIDCFREKVENPTEFAILASDRHFGIGSDGLVLIMPSENADFRMRMFNPDGSEAEMCGNAIRCVGKYVFDNNLTGKDHITVQTQAGIKKLDLIADNGKVGMVRVDMGAPELVPSKIPVDSQKERFIAETVEAAGTNYTVTCVSMGNPHAVIRVADVSAFPVAGVGPTLETHKLFPKKTNVEFIEVVGRKMLKMRVWERGTGETMACGTGACAAVVASVLNGFCDMDAEITVELPGGRLLIEWASDGHVFMTGPAELVFEGEWLL